MNHIVLGIDAALGDVGESGAGNKCNQPVCRIVVARLASMAPGALIVRAAQGGVLRVFVSILIPYSFRPITIRYRSKVNR